MREKWSEMMPKALYRPFHSGEVSPVRSEHASSEVSFTMYLQNQNHVHNHGPKDAPISTTSRASLSTTPRCVAVLEHQDRRWSPEVEVTRPKTKKAVPTRDVLLDPLPTNGRVGHPDRDELARGLELVAELLGKVPARGAKVEQRWNRGRAAPTRRWDDCSLGGGHPRAGPRRAGAVARVAGHQPDVVVLASRDVGEGVVVGERAADR